MAKKARRPGKTGRGRREISGAAEAAQRDAEFRSEVRWFIHDWGHGGHLEEDVRAAYGALIAKARGIEGRHAAALLRAKRAFGYALTHAIKMVPPGEVRPGLRVEFGVIQMPEAEAVDVEVSDGRGGLVRVVTGKAEAGGGWSREDAEAVNGYLKLAGARVA